MTSPNPLLAAFDQLPPEHKAAIMQSMAPKNPMQGNQPPSPQVAASQHAQPMETPPPASGLIPAPNAPQLPKLSGDAPNVKAPLGTIQGDAAERTRLMDTGSGISQIYHKVTNSDFGQNHPVMGKILGGLGQGLATIGDIGLTAAAPGLASMVPGTSMHHASLLKGANNALATDEANAKDEAQTKNLDMAPDLKIAQQQLDNQKLQNTQDAAQAKLTETQRMHDQQLREHGYKLDDSGKIVPLSYEEMSEPQQAVHDLKASQEELADASAALKKAQTSGIPAQMQMAQHRIEVAQQNANTAAGRLGLSREALNVHQQEFNQKENDNVQKLTQKTSDKANNIIQSASMAHTLQDAGDKGNAEADPALALLYFKIIKGPDGAGIRFTQTEQKLIFDSRNSAGDLDAIVQKVMGGGEKFTPEQRANIVKITDMYANAAQQQQGASPSKPGATPSQPSAVPAAGGGLEVVRDASGRITGIK